MTVSVANGPGNRTDWVGLAAAGAPDVTVVAWVYLNGSQTAPNAGMASATVLMTAPISDASYEARFYVDDSYSVLTRASFSVRGTAPTPSPPSITVDGSANAIVGEGAVLTVNVANGPGNRTDWIGLAAAGAANTAVIAWRYLSGSQTAPNAGVTSAVVMMTAPTTDAFYEARFYVDDSYTVLTRASFSVRGTAPSPAPPPPSPPPPPPAAQPVITVAPNSPEVPDTTPLGAVIATYRVVMSDGSPFTGTVRFGAPFFDGGGIFALSGNNIIVNPSGPGLGPNMTSITDHITLEAIL